MIQKFCMLCHGITPKTRILLLQTTTEIKLIGYLILGEIKFCNVINKDFEKKSQNIKKHNNFTFHDYLPQCRS